MLRCLSGHSHKCCAAWPNSSARGLADADGHLRLTTDPTFSTEQGLHDLSRIGVWASAALATAILWAQKPEAPVKCTAFDDFSNTDHMPLVFDCPWPECRTRNAHPGHRHDLYYEGRVVWCQQCNKRCRIYRPCDRRVHGILRRGATGLATVGALVCPPLALYAGVTGSVYTGAMAAIEDRPGEFFRSCANTISLGLVQNGSQVASAVAHTMNAAQAIHGLIEASQEQSWMGVLLCTVSVMNSIVQFAQSCDQATLQKTEQALEVARRQVSNLGREVQQGGPIQHGAQINGRLFRNLRQAATARDQIQVMYASQMISHRELTWLSTHMDLVQSVSEGTTETFEGILVSVQKLQAQKPNVVVETN